MITNTKFKKILMILLFLTIIFSMVFFENIFAEDFEIKENDFLQITHIEHLVNITNNLDKNFILMNDLDFNNSSHYLNSSNKGK